MDQLARKSKHWLKVKRPNRAHHDEEALRRLGESMKENGQQQPINCLPDGTIISGERRWRAALLSEGLDELWVRIVSDPLTAKQIRVLRVTENLHRLDITPWERFQEIQGFREDDPAMTAKEMAEALCLDPSSITRYLSPNDCIEAVREALRLGQIGIKACYEISQAAAEDQAALLAKARRGSAAAVAKARRQGGEAEEAVKVDSFRMKLAGGYTVTLKGKELSLAKGGELLSIAVRELESAKRQGLDAKTAQAVWRDKAKANGTVKTHA